MLVHKSVLPESVKSRGTAAAAGSFDGLHLGHRLILGRLIDAAAEHDVTPIAVTFDPHPRSMVGDGNQSISMLYSFDERLQLLASVGIEHVFVIDFDDAFRSLTPAEYAKQMVIGAWNAKHIVAGFNHTFGKDRTGDGSGLIALGQEFGFGVDIVQPVVIQDHVVSSSTIRRLILEGDMPLANAMLDRKFSLAGKVVRGFGRGRRMGCPTANLGDIAQGKIIPRDGIYAAIAEVGEYAYPAAVSIGFNPTFGGQRHSVEAHLLDFDADLYDKMIVLRIIKRLRGEIKFSGEESLSVQMRQDITDIRNILTEEGFTLEPRKLLPHENVI